MIKPSYVSTSLALGLLERAPAAGRPSSVAWWTASNVILGCPPGSYRLLFEGDQPSELATNSPSAVPEVDGVLPRADDATLLGAFDKFLSYWEFA